MTDKKHETCYVDKLLTNYKSFKQCPYSSALKSFCLRYIERPSCLNFALDFSICLKNRFHLSLSSKVTLSIDEDEGKMNSVNEVCSSAARLQRIISLEKEVDSLKQLLGSNENNK